MNKLRLGIFPNMKKENVKNSLPKVLDLCDKAEIEAAIGVRGVEDALATDEFDQSLGWADRPKIFSVARVVDGLRHAQIAFVHLRRPTPARTN